MARGIELASERDSAIKKEFAKGSNHMSKIYSFLLLSFSLIGIAALASPTMAQDDPPGRVARLNYIQGSVSYQVSGDQDWVRADPNRPLTTGDNLWVDQNSRGEVHIGSTALRLSNDTGISFLTLDDRTVQIQLAQGELEVHLRRLAAGEAFEIDTPNLALTFTRAGEYVVQTDPGGSFTMIIAREGEAQVTGGGDSFDIRAGQQYTFTGTDELTCDAQPSPGYDDFEEWCQSRDEREDRAVAARYVSRDVDGYYDLDEYGSWESEPEYGMVWYPTTVAVGWVPYHFGHWVYIAPWGWTWVDEAPWGFAPFHYGRWCYVGNRWGWVPGPMVVRPVYAPALVAFVGGGGFSFGVSFGGGSTGVGWFPLGPRDVYVPGYRCTPRYIQNINITNTRVVNVTQVTNVYNTAVINRDVTRVSYSYGNDPRWVTAVSRETFVGARPVAQGSMHITAEQIGRARVVDSAPVAPTRASYVSSRAARADTRPPVPFSQRPAVVRLNPAIESRPSQAPTPFGRQQGQPPASQGQTTPQQQPRPGYRVFQRPGTISQPPQGNTTQQPSRGPNAPAPEQGGRAGTYNPPQQQQQQQPQYEQRPRMRYTPPVKARDEMYDVRPPGQRQQAAPPQRQEQRRAEPLRQQPENRQQRNDSKHDR